MSEALTSLSGTLNHVWEELARVKHDRDAPCRLATLATNGPWPEARMVVLRDADERRRCVDIYSDTRAAKVAQLRADPRATLLFWLPEAGFQIRLRGRFSVLTVDEAEPQWQRLGDGGRRAYGGQPAPATPIESPEQHRTTSSRDNFAVLRGAVKEIETLHLGAVHRRARFTLGEDGFRPEWIAP
ncbi:pyridoxamine 5'-phosphate oxidase family protein [Oceaniglobus ichthyenteri]|uniref:pyridoxamine 5'-phosphate oxidase family protein n=1 Tax=Oceaniglobus ichthyenteri TaxID=2136177 RepID=UPI000D39154E|nr:pyridoxamine 5'-phosphate oxidase family protein [Oceaniglobus ichthyenteri]